MSNTRYFLGGAALLGAGYYVYQQRLEQSRITVQDDSLKNKIPGFGSGSSKYDPREGPGQHAGRKVDEAAYNARDKFEDLKYDASKKLDSTFSQAEKDKAKLANWTSDKISGAQESLDQAAAKSKEKADAFYKEAHKDDPKGLKKWGQDIKSEAEAAKNKTEDTLEGAKDSVLGSLTSAKDSIVGSKNKAEREVSNAAEKTKQRANDLSNQASNKADEASEKASSWFSSAKEDTKDTLNQAQQKGEEKSRSFFNWGSSKKDESKEAIDAAYDDAQKIYDDAQKRYKETKRSWFSWSKDEKKDQLHQEAQKQLDAAQKNLDSAKAKFKDWTNRTTETVKGKVNEYTPNSRGDSYDKANEFFTGELINRREGSSTGGYGFYGWLRGGRPSPTEEERIAHGARRGLRGWGENAEQFADEEYDEARRLAGHAPGKKSWGVPGWFSSGSNKDEERIARDARQGLRGWGENAEQFANDEYDESKRQITKAQKEADARLKEWNAWANKKYDDSAQGAQDYYNDAQAAVQRAQKDLNDNASHWWSWSKNKSKDFELQAKKNLEDAETKLSDATTNLKKWGNDAAESANLKFWSSADDAIHSTKEGLNTVNKKTQEGLSDARSWVQDQKK